jgi:hypothetical protein
MDSICKTIEAEGKKVNTTGDILLESILSEVSRDRLILEGSIKFNKRGSTGKILKAYDQIFDDDYTCLKGFILANRNMSDVNVAKTANEVWDLFVKYNIRLHKLSFESQFTNANILFAKLQESEMHAKIMELVGVNDCLQKAKTSLKNAEACYEELNSKESKIDDVIPPSSQKNILRSLINDKLLPHLYNWDEVQPEKYCAFLDAIERRIEEVNTKARARKTRNTKENIKDDAAEN